MHLYTVVTVVVFWAAFLTASSLPTSPKRCHSSVTATSAQSSIESEARMNTEETKQEPRCFETLLGWFTENQVVGSVDDYTGGPSGIPEYSSMPGLQGGALTGPEISGSMQNPSHLAPGLPSHAMDAINNAQLMNSQLQGLSGQFSGAQGPSIPLSPTNFRHSQQGTYEPHHGLPVHPFYM